MRHQSPSKILPRAASRPTTLPQRKFSSGKVPLVLRAESLGKSSAKGRGHRGRVPLDLWLQGPGDAWGHGIMSSCVHGRMRPWPCRPMSPWACLLGDIFGWSLHSAKPYLLSPPDSGGVELRGTSLPSSSKRPALGFTGGRISAPFRCLKIRQTY